MAQAIISRRGGTTNEEKPLWEPHPDWYDIRAIYDADERPGFTKRCIIMTFDDSLTTTITKARDGITAFKTSDGSFYNINNSGTATHTWKLSQDKFCSEGYKTRWIIFYSAVPEIPFTANTSIFNTDAAWLHLGDCVFQVNFTGIHLRAITSDFNYNSMNTVIMNNSIAKPLEYIEVASENCTFAIQKAVSLKYIKFKDTLKTFLNFSLMSCTSITEIIFPESLESLPSNTTFRYCTSLKNIYIPDTTVTDAMLGGNRFEGTILKNFNLYKNMTSSNFPDLRNSYSITSLTFKSDNAMIYMAYMSGDFLNSLKVVNLTDGYNKAITFGGVSTVASLSRTSLLDMIDKLADRSSTTALTFSMGTKNLNKLTADEKAVATAKNWTLS